MVDAAYAPERGHLVWLNFTPHAGHEQAGRRPALVLTPASYNALTGLMIGVPITSRVKNYPFEIALPKECAIQGVVLCDQVRSMDWRSRKADFACMASDETLEQVSQKLGTLLQIV